MTAPSAPLAAFLADRGLADLDRTVHPEDEMLAFGLPLFCGAPGLAEVEYYRSGLLAHEALAQVLTARFGSVAATPSLLDFASGFGRTTRFLVRELPAERIHVTEIKPEAVAFQHRQFGVTGTVTTTDPASLAPGRRFAAVWAASFFTHLPRTTFLPWLERLWSLVEEGGVLAFSVHGEGLVPPGRALEADGFLFERVSESTRLDLDSYGSSWVSEGFVAQALAEVSGGRASWRRIPRGLWHFQDLYLVTAAPHEAAGLPFERGPWGFLEGADALPDGRVRLAGWVAEPGQAPPRVVVSVAGGPWVEAAPGLARPEISQVDPDMRAGDWLLVLPVERAPRAEDVVLAKVVGATGRELLLFAGRLDTAALLCRAKAAGEAVAAARAELGALRAEVEALQGRLAWMQASRFWRLRERWFGWKRRLGLRSW
ncbi:MAG TPA: class I SAM-dependent methyltransferase [Thermoanaerobaculia bacterium]|nr:class I SAM-dependent methyltransferase [Thermoanaerobaculia bacterium]